MGFYFFIAFFVISYIELVFYSFETFKDMYEIISEYIDKRRVKKSLRERKATYNQNTKNNYKITEEAKGRVAYLKEKYPLADEKLLNNHLIIYSNCLSLEAVKNSEEQVINSHYKNKNSNDSISIKKVDKNLIKTTNHIDSINAHPIMMKFYNVDNMYLLMVNNEITGECRIYQSPMYEELLKIANDVYESRFLELNVNQILPIERLFHLNKYNKTIKL